MTGSAQTPRPDACLLLFAKVPRAGRVKTRLCPPLAPEQAAGLYAAFLEDVVRGSIPLRGRQIDLRLLLHPWDERGALPPLAVGPEDWRPQRGASLAERMDGAVRACLAEGYSRVVLRNTDSPLLPADRVVAAFEALGSPAVDLVLGPDSGGGYYLIGMKRALGELFAGLSAWSADQVFVRTMARARSLGLSILVLPTEADVDVPGDLARLAAALPDASAAATGRAVDDLRRAGVGLDGPTRR